MDARRYRAHLLALVILGFLLAASVAFSQEAPFNPGPGSGLGTGREQDEDSPPPPPPPRDFRPGHPRFAQKDKADPADNRPDSALREGPPHGKNWQVWEQASEEERQAFRERAKAFRKEAIQRIDALLTEKNLHLDEAQRRAFFYAYMKGKREIERALHKKIQAEREQLDQELIERLLQQVSSGELKAPSVPSVSPAPHGPRKYPGE